MTDDLGARPPLPRRNEFGQPIGEPVGSVAARPVEPVSLAGRTCRLDPLGVGDAPELFAALADGAGDEQWTYLPFGPCADVAAMREVVAGLVADPGFVPFAIRAGGRVVGTASYLRIEPAGGTIEVGAIVYGAGARRAAPATEAMYLLARHAIDELGYRRYEWKCDALNAPSRRAALRLGFRFEGVWRQAAAYKGRNRDTAWYAMTDGDWAGLRAGYEAWFDALDADGRQGETLEACLGRARAVERDPS